MPTPPPAEELVDNVDPVVDVSNEGPAVQMHREVQVGDTVVWTTSKGNFRGRVLKIIHPNVQVDLLDDDGEATGKKKFINKSEVAVDVDTSE